jgi:folate-binding protein YgfZ
MNLNPDSAAESDFVRARQAAIIFPRPPLPVYQISGTDAVRYLHGRLTQDVKSLMPGSGARTLILTPQGKIEGQFLLLRQEQGFLLISDPLPDNEAEKAFMAALLRFKVADDITVEPCSLSCLSLVGPKSSESLEQLLHIRPPQSAFEHTTLAIDGRDILIAAHPRRGFPGFDILLSPDEKEKLIARFASHLPLGGPAAWEMIRIASGSPQMGSDLDEHILGPEIDLTELVSFDKGCYAGQEVVEMATARGRPNRKLLVLRAKSQSAFAAGTEINVADKKCGFITSSCYFPERGESLSLAFVKTALADEPAFDAGGLALLPVAL